MTLYEQVEELTRRVGELEARASQSMPVAEPVLVAGGPDCPAHDTRCREGDCVLSRTGRGQLAPMKPIGALEAIGDGCKVCNSDPDSFVTSHEFMRVVEEREVLRARAVSAETELFRLGHGDELIFAFGANGEPICTSRVGDAAWDTRENRAATFRFIERVLARARVATQGPEDTGR